MKKIVLTALSLVLVVALTIGGTLAYLTDRDSEANVFTVGNVEIDLTEDFEQGAKLLPGQDVEKVVKVENTGSNDAWVWVTIAVPSALDSADPSMNVLHFNYAKDSVAEGQWKWVDKTNWANVPTENINGTDYNVYAVLYQTALKSGETTATSAMTKVYLDTALDIDPEGNWHKVVNGTATDINWNSTTNGAPVMYVSAYAIQADDTIDTIEKAYAAYNTQWGDNGAEYAEPATVVATAEEFEDAVAAGGAVALSEDVVITDTLNIEKETNIDLNGKSLTVSVLEAKADTTISGGKLIHGESTYPQVSVSAGTLTMEDVEIVSEEYCNLVTSGSAEASEYAGIQIWGGKAVLDDCTISIKTDKIRYSNSIFGVGIHGGELTMNGGSITVESHGSTKPQYDYQAAIFAGSNAEKVVNLNNVAINIGPNAKNLYAWGGNTTVNTTDTEGSWASNLIGVRNGGTYTINYVK